MKTPSVNRILVYTMAAIVVIAVYITVNSYYTQVAIYEEKELFKLDCIANAVAYKISGDEHDGLIDRYPDPSHRQEVMEDTSYQKIHMLMAGAKMMTQVPSEMYTVVRGSTPDEYLSAIGTDRTAWLAEVDIDNQLNDTLYKKGGMLGRFDYNGEARLGAMSPVVDSEGHTVGVLRVEETFDSFLGKARDQIYMNLLISLVFVVVVGTLMFFSVRSILARQQRLALERAELEGLRQELVANVSHDLRTPLASIHGFVETLLMKGNDLDDESRRKYLQTTLQSTDRLRNLVDELFELSKLESKERKLQAEPMALGELVSDVTAHLRVAAAEKSIGLSVEVPDGLPRVMADVALVDRVVQNLVGNAIAHCRPGDQVDVRVFTLPGRVGVEVRDNGPGIPAEDLPHIFDRFRRGRSGSKGSGLGLAIVRGALELHQTSCEVFSETGKGSTFRFTLPVA